MIGVVDMDKKNIFTKTVVFIVLSLLSLSFVYPMFYMLINSLKTRAEYATNPFNFPAGKLQINNYGLMISQFKILLLFRNTAVVTLGSGILLLVFAICASYAFAKLRFKGKGTVYIAVMAAMFVPVQVTLIPVYVMFAKMNLINNFWSCILANLAAYLPSNILLMTSYFRGISQELIEASRMDGCNYFGTVRNVVIPVGKPIIVVNIIFNSIYTWNDLLTPMILLSKMDVRTVMVALAALMGRYVSDPPFQLAGLFLSTIPIFAVYIIFQQQIFEGITMGAIK